MAALAVTAGVEAFFCVHVALNAVGKKLASHGGLQGENVFLNNLTLAKLFLIISEGASLKAYLE